MLTLWNGKIASLSHIRKVDILKLIVHTIIDNNNYFAWNMSLDSISI